jgi:hypothetical protein
LIEIANSAWRLPYTGITGGWHELTKSPPIKAGWLVKMAS